MINSLGNSISRVGLVGEWLLDGNRLDTSGNGYNGTATNVTYVKTTKGYQAQAGSFNGSSSIVSISNDLGIAGGNITMSAYVKLNAEISSGYYTIMKQNDLTSGVGFQMYYEYNGGTRRLTFQRVRVGIAGNPVYYNITLGTSNRYHLSLVNNTSDNTIKIYLNGVLVGSATSSNSNGNATEADLTAIGSYGTSLYANAQIQLARIYNRVLSQEEIQLLYLEGEKLLGPTNIRAYPKLLDGLVGYFENPTGTELWNIATGVKATYVGGTNTTDNLGINKAIINPNYTWSSITYTTGYTFENSGSGWNIVTSPAGLSATGINRTTTLRNIFLFNRTLSADEISTLQALCNSDYIYPSPSYDLPNLREGLVLDLNEQGKDLSGNGNNGTLVNSPVVVRQGKAKGLTYNGSNQYISCPNTSFNSGGTNLFSSNHIVSFTNITSNRSLLMGGTTGTGINIYYSANQLVFSKPNLVDLIIAFTPVIGKIYNITCIANSSGMYIYIDGVLVGSNTNTSNFTNTTSTIGVGAYILGGVVQNGFYLQGNIFRTRIRNRTLSAKEIEQLYYSQKANYVY